MIERKKPGQNDLNSLKFEKETPQTCKGERVNHSRKLPINELSSVR